MKAALTLLAILAQLALLDLAHGLERPTTSPAQDARNQQLQEAARLQGQPKPDCVWISQRVCVSAAELQRVQTKGKQP